MPSKSTGTLIKNADGSFSARVTLQKQRPLFPLPHCRTEATARERLAVLAQLAQQMTAARCDFEEARFGLQKVADARPGTTLKEACATVDDLIAGWRPRIANVPTLDEVFERWDGQRLDGTPLPKEVRALDDEYSDDVKPRADTSRSAARSNYKLYVRPLLGHLPVDEVTLKRCNEAKHKLPKSLKRADSRRQALQPLQSLLQLCVHPLGLIERSPLPRKWLPKKEGPRTLQWMYPDEDAALMACKRVPLWGRMLVGYLNRNGGRIQETLDATLAHFDLQRGVARLDAVMTKTRDDRSWMLDDGSCFALIAWRDLQRADCASSAYMFVDDEGAAISKHGLPELLREWLQLALDDARGTALECVVRSELFAKTDHSRWLCIHDCRATFATVKLAIGKSSKWVRQRTGHKTDDQLSVYERTVQSFRELNMGDFAPLHEAIPELRQRCVSGKRKPLVSQLDASYIVKEERSEQVPDIAGTPRKTASATMKTRTFSQAADASQTLREEQLEAELALLRAQLKQLQARVRRDERADAE